MMGGSAASRPPGGILSVDMDDTKVVVATNILVKIFDFVPVSL